MTFCGQCDAENEDKMALVKMALDIDVQKQRRTVYDVGIQEIELAIAWAKGDLKLTQVTKALQQSHQRAYSSLALSFREGVRTGRIIVSVPSRPRVVWLCGSSRFMQSFFDEGLRLTLAGEIVLSVGASNYAGLGQDVADRLDELHLRKIDLTDYVRVLNVGGYIGKSTQKEIEYAIQTGKPVEYLWEGENAD
jgi:hypothetical protein